MSMPSCTPSLLTPRTLEDANMVLQWAKDYISKPHPDLGREGAICPFVLPSIQRDHFNIALHYEVDGSDPDMVKQILLCTSEVYLNLTPTEEPDNIYKTILVAFPNIPDEHGKVLDEIHAELKDYFVCKGMMIGQFHKHCSEPAARNPDFKISISPIPLVAIRNMSIHDILFLNTRKDWFLEYETRFGCKYQKGEVTSPTYKNLFNRTRELYSAQVK